MKQNLRPLALAALLCALSFGTGAFLNGPAETPITKEAIRGAETLFGLAFTDTERDSLLKGMQEQREDYESIRKVNLPNDVAPALLFNPVPPGMTFDRTRKPFKVSSPGKVELPANRDDLAFYSVLQLSRLIHDRKITSVELTRFCLDRLKKYGPKLECVVSLTEELALAQAQKADADLKAGKDRGLLHGIPYGAKDLFAKAGYKTTWGSVPYKEQVINEDATVIARLEAAGAVLVAKLTMGELAMGDVWFGGTTRNPWDIGQGSSGSSAGSASAVAAGLVPFALGTETLGSIVSPATVCGVTGLRPTFGRVSRAGAMALSWSMDKIGPMCRTVEDCAVVFNAIYGPDGKDLTVADLPFNYDPSVKLGSLRVGYLKRDFERDYPNKSFDSTALARLRGMGVELVPLELPQLPIRDLTFIISVEAAAAFDELTRSDRDDLMVRQGRGAWPNIFREGQLVSAVQYLQANRVRSLLIREMAGRLKDIDVYVTPSRGSANLALTNLTGHPCVTIPNGFSAVGTPLSITFVGQLYGEARMLAAAKAYQDATDFHRKHPNLVW
ncbi:MAG: Glutamyl-tRNA(Gln) amidotransferase subunit A-like protein [uncultured Cytophagales bacterium]|uniref:Glutamyl-tRNA(Gln) amidotransferase subunit A-like protein n=1 Tax=uncultured Cytophagales bacterium TaxID=158755 RepID=A0A6J4K1M0_9SPHI|nr:MAG: Glutamyl-tRNA(Gln) amidotransferase subunit A-like protein [uncultured Cytophagales bacterium]